MQAQTLNVHMFNNSFARLTITPEIFNKFNKIETMSNPSLLKKTA